MSPRSRDSIAIQDFPNPFRRAFLSFVPDPSTGRYHKFPQIGRLEIGVKAADLFCDIPCSRGPCSTRVASMLV
jgi:hypothetical protein